MIGRLGLIKKFHHPYRETNNFRLEYIPRTCAFCRRKIHLAEYQTTDRRLSRGVTLPRVYAEIRDVRIMG